jgi:hypothetical protein
MLKVMSLDPSDVPSQEGCGKFMWFRCVLETCGYAE